MNNRVKVVFNLEQDEDGYPPASAESLLADDLGNELYRIVSVPIFALGVSNGDTVRGMNLEDKIVGSSKEQEGGHSTFRVLVLDPNPSAPHVLNRVGQLKHELSQLKCVWVDSKIRGLAALDIPPDASIVDIRRVLMNEVRAGWLDIEEATVSLLHRS